jgi:hypothetical protein
VSPESGSADESGWLLEPPQPGTVNLHIQLGDDVELSPAARDALERLIGELNGDEVEGFAHGLSCPTVWDDCNPFTCNLTNCQPLTSRPCAYDMDCKVTEFGRGFGGGIA